MSRSFSVRTIPLSTISTDGYQRDRIDSLVDKIVAKFDPAQWDLPKVVERPDGTFRVVAGQHRVDAASVLADSGPWPFDTEVGHIQAQVVEGVVGTKEEADLFMADATNKKALTPFDKHRALLVREDRCAVEVQDALDRLSIKLVKRQKVKSGGSISAVKALYNLWSRGHGAIPGGGARLVFETLRLASMWDEADTYRFDGLLVQGLGEVALEHLKLSGKTTRLERFVRRTPAMTVASLAQRWSVANGGVFSNTPMPYANVIRERM